MARDASLQRDEDLVVLLTSHRGRQFGSVALICAATLAVSARCSAILRNRIVMLPIFTQCW